MKFRSLSLALVLVAGISLSSTAFSQDDKTKPQNPSSQTQPADQNPTSADQNQAQPAAQQPAATDQSQTQPVADQEQPATDPGKDADKKDKDKKDKKDKDKDKDKKDKDKDKKDRDKDKKEAKSKHSGGKDDVDAIGNRKVAGWDWYSIESEIRMGKEYATQIEASLKLVTDPTINEYVNRVGQNVVRFTYSLIVGSVTSFRLASICVAYSLINEYV